MDADRSREAMTDAGIDREMEALFAVDPSPAFVARVRTRIAAEPHRSPWLTWWPVAVTAAIAIAIIAAFVARSRQADPVQPLTASVLPNSATITGAPERHASIARALEPVHDSPRTRDVERRVQRAGAIDAGNADLLIDRRESAALRALITGVRDGRVDLEPVMRAATPAAMELPPVATIAIAPLTIDLLEGVQQ